MGDSSAEKIYTTSPSVLEEAFDRVIEEITGTYTRGRRDYGPWSRDPFRSPERDRNETRLPTKIATIRFCAQRAKQEAEQKRLGARGIRDFQNTAPRNLGELPPMERMRPPGSRQIIQCESRCHWSADWTTPNLGYFVHSCLREGESNPPPALSLTEPRPAVYRPSGIFTFPLANFSGCSVTGTSAADSEHSLTHKRHCASSSVLKRPKRSLQSDAARTNDGSDAKRRGRILFKRAGMTETGFTTVENKTEEKEIRESSSTEIYYQIERNRILHKVK